jgi:hypothetical protein
MTLGKIKGLEPTNHFFKTKNHIGHSAAAATATAAVAIICTVLMSC